MRGDRARRPLLPYLIVGGLVLAMLVLAVVLASVQSTPDSTENEEVREQPGFEWADADRLAIPDEASEPGTIDWVLSRPRREVWGAEEISEYWLDPAEIGRQLLDEQVEREIRELLREVP